MFCQPFMASVSWQTYQEFNLTMSCHAISPSPSPSILPHTQHYPARTHSGLWILGSKLDYGLGAGLDWMMDWRLDNGLEIGLETGCWTEDWTGDLMLDWMLDWRLDAGLETGLETGDWTGDWTELGVARRASAAY